ncbi:hypothetical protein EV702DRAFT_1062424 [Suillus placidus]|uniref:Ankyrin repeat protein n=1 Tax=Suillus placidus TaxID=48579 RepID=A0A9P7A7C3_9AGAM|nr:hypothetical protein EV702DRAFT_1062424 [Suillus placidus]
MTMEDEDKRRTINRLLLVNALTEGALEDMMEDPEYFDENTDEFLGDFNCTDALGNTGNARQGHPADVAALCGGAVDLDLYNKNGDTPLYIALKEIDDSEARLDIVAELLSCGAENKQAMPGGLTPLEYAKSRFPSEKNLHEIIANPPRDDEDEIQPEQMRKQMYDSSDFVDSKRFTDSLLITTFTFYLPDDEDGGEGSSPETE